MYPDDLLELMEAARELAKESKEARNELLSHQYFKGNTVSFPFGEEKDAPVIEMFVNGYSREQAEEHLGKELVDEYWPMDDEKNDRDGFVGTKEEALEVLSSFREFLANALEKGTGQLTTDETKQIEENLQKIDKATLEIENVKETDMSYSLRENLSRLVNELTNLSAKI